MIDNDIISAYEEDYVAQLNYIESGDRLIHHDYVIESNGEVKVRVHGRLLNELCTEPLFTNTFQTITQ